MRNMYNAADAADIRARVLRLQATSERQWGKMNAAQMAAHCATALELSLGDRPTQRIFLGRIIGGMIKRAVVSNDKPLGRNSPTAPVLVIADERNMEQERTRLLALLDRFTQGGPTACTGQPHSFFGPMTPDEWSILMFKHMDHHLRQFGA